MDSANGVRLVIDQLNARSEHSCFVDGKTVQLVTIHLARLPIQSQGHVDYVGLLVKAGLDATLLIKIQQLDFCAEPDLTCVRAMLSLLLRLVMSSPTKGHHLAGYVTHNLFPKLLKVESSDVVMDGMSLLLQLIPQLKMPQVPSVDLLVSVIDQQASQTDLVDCGLLCLASLIVQFPDCLTLHNFSGTLDSCVKQKLRPVLKQLQYGLIKSPHN